MADGHPLFGSVFSSQPAQSLLSVSATRLALVFRSLVGVTGAAPERALLYGTRPYLEAYAAHTDQRVLKDPHAAVGGKWEAVGRLQFDYLVANGLRPDSRLLDLGCGTLRGGRHFIPYLNPLNYTGTDISLKAIEYAHRLVRDENLAAREPRLIHRRRGEAFFADLGDAHFDFILAQSVFTHLPADVVEECFASVGRVMGPSAVFFFTFQHEAEHRRKDLKDFAHPSRLFADLAERHNFLFETRDDYNHPRGQTMASLRHQSLCSRSQRPGSVFAH